MSLINAISDLNLKDQESKDGVGFKVCKSENQKIIDILTKLKDQEYVLGNKFKVYAYALAIHSIKVYPKVKNFSKGH